MATVTTRLRPYRRNLRRPTLALSTVVLAVGLALGGGALSPASAFASEHRGTEQDGTVHIQAWAGPFASWDVCSVTRRYMDSLGYRTTPCIHEPEGWFFQYF